MLPPCPENERKVTRSVSRPSSIRHGNEERMASDAEVAMMMMILIYVVRGKIGPEKLNEQQDTVERALQPLLRS